MAAELKAALERKNASRFQVIIRLPEVMRRTGLSKPSIYKMIHRGVFPPAIVLMDSRAVGWVESQVQEWIDNKIATGAVRGTTNKKILKRGRGPDGLPQWLRKARAAA